LAFRLHHASSVNPQAEALKKRTKQFALDVLAFNRTLPRSDDVRDVARQLSRAATSVAAGYRSTCRSRSAAEFVARIGMALDSADESALWLEIIMDGGMSESSVVFNLLEEANQLTAILAASSITASTPLSSSSSNRRRS
jgi:four helix bundle protein